MSDDRALTPEDLDALEELLAAATPGDWHPGCFADDTSTCNCKSVLSECYAGSVCAISVDNGLWIQDGGNDSPPEEEAKANLRLIPAMKNALPALIAAAKRDSAPKGPRVFTLGRGQVIVSSAVRGGVPMAIFAEPASPPKPGDTPLVDEIFDGENLRPNCVAIELPNIRAAMAYLDAAKNAVEMLQQQLHEEGEDVEAPPAPSEVELTGRAMAKMEAERDALQAAVEYASSMRLDTDPGWDWLKRWAEGDPECAAHVEAYSRHA
jgi:hypothetical protein